MLDIQIDNENSFRNALKDGVNLFLGSGFSVLAKDRKGNHLPTEQEFKSELSSVFNVNSERLGLEQVYAIIESTQQDKLAAYVNDRFSVSHYDNRYKKLDRLAIKNIISTNIDNLLQLSYSESKLKYINDVSLTGAAFKDKTAIDFVPLRGTVANSFQPNLPRFTSITKSFNPDSDRLRLITDYLRKYPTLFWGFNVSDANLLQTFLAAGSDSSDRWIVITPQEADDGTLSYFRASDFQVIVSDVSNTLRYLKAFVETSVKTALPNVSLTAEELFPDGTIPKIDKVPVRPIKDFFLGAPPTWYDVLSDSSLYRTEYFRSIKNHIEDPSGKTVIVVGLPGCGKTTLLMQLASQYFCKNYQLMYDSLSLDKAHLIKNKLQGAKALIFIDNFSDSLDAFQFFSAEKNIQVVGADRSYNFEIVSHKISRNSSIVVDVTDISERDVQKCFQSIPESIRRRSFRVPSTPLRVIPSLFEIIDNNVTGARLRDRYRKVLQELGASEPVLRDILIVVSYVNKARVPLTLDMLMAYLRDITARYEDIYEMVNKLNSLISDVAGTSYGGDYYKEDQDYYVPRSTIVSEAVVQSVDGINLRKVLERFHDNVSPYRIHNFHVFKRHAFDHRIISRAFDDAQDGKKFYEKLYLRDNSPYLLQQGALYLSRKKRHPEAFSMVDRAVNESNGKIWSIRNSHAIILFKANIEHFGDPEAKRALRESMSTLTECYKWDKRKPFHAITFADHALQYLNVYGSRDGKDFLETAQQWLTNEKINNSWNRDVKRLLNSVERELENIR